MIKIIQSGQVGKTKDLLEMYRFRARVFKELMGWDVHVDPDGLEVDEYDIDESIYMLAFDDQKKVVGSWRILPTNMPNMIRDIWPFFLEDIDVKSSPNCWETSRFAVHSDTVTSVRGGLSLLNDVTAKMFCALTELCIMCNVEAIYTLYDFRIAKILQRLDCVPVEKTSAHKIDGKDCFVGKFIPDAMMLNKIRASSGITEQLVNEKDLPPILNPETKQLFKHNILENNNDNSNINEQSKKTTSSNTNRHNDFKRSHHSTGAY